MPIFHCFGEKTTTLVSEAHVVAEGYRSAAQKFRESYGVMPNSIDGREVIGVCEACESVLFEGMSFSSDDDGVMFCPACYRELAKETTP